MGHKFSCILPGPPGTPLAAHTDLLTSKLYIGPIDFLAEDSVLAQFHIRAIVSCLPHKPKGMDDVLNKHHIDQNAAYLVFPMEDSADNYISLWSNGGINEALNFVHKHRLQGDSVLIHCDAGNSRSACLATAYLIKYLNLSLQESTEWLLKQRPTVDLSLFRRELVGFEKRTRLAAEMEKGDPRSEFPHRQYTMSTSSDISLCDLLPSSYSSDPISPTMRGTSVCLLNPISRFLINNNRNSTDPVSVSVASSSGDSFTPGSSSAQQASCQFLHMQMPPAATKPPLFPSMTMAVTNLPDSTSDLSIPVPISSSSSSCCSTVTSISVPSTTTSSISPSVGAPVANTSIPRPLGRFPSLAINVAPFERATSTMSSQFEDTPGHRNSMQALSLYGQTLSFSKKTVATVPNPAFEETIRLSTS